MAQKLARSVMVLLLMLTWLGVSAPPQVNAQSDSASLAIHSRFCPTNYDMSDIYNDCHDTIGTRGIWFDVSSPVSRVRDVNLPDEQGNVVVDNLHAGTYTVTSSLRQASVSSAVYCSSGEGTPGQWIDHQPTEYGWGYYDVTLAPGVATICDWYTIPDVDILSTQANITIRDRFCPVGYTDFGSEWRDCLDNIGVNVIEYHAQGPTDREEWQAQGNIAFTGLQPGTYTISSDIGGFWDLDGVVYCSTWENAGFPFLSQQTDSYSSLTLTVEAGDDVICDWYHYPTPDIYQEGVETRISVVTCDSPTVFSRETRNNCPQLYGVRLLVYPALEPQFSQSCVYDAESGCLLYLPVHIPLTVELDERDIPAGWEPLCNPCTWQTAGEWTGFIVQLNPIDANFKGD